MRFMIKYGRQFSNEGVVYSAPVIARKLNGYKVINPDGDPTFICKDDVDVLEISEQEKGMPIEW